MGGYVRGVVIDALIVGLLATAGLWLIGYEYAVVAGLISAIGELFPVIGPVLAAVPIVLVALLDSPRQAIIVLVFYILLQQVEGQILTPLVMKSQTDVPEVLVLFALVSGAAVAGLLGALVAIPAAAAARVIVVDALAPALRRRWVDGT
jgi:predicted PurR-regulated permease PerM